MPAYAARMEVLGRVLGIAAAIGYRTSRFSVNFIRLNWILMGCVIAGAVGSGNELRYAIANGAEPRDLTVTEAIAHVDVDSNFVRLHGVLCADAMFQHATVRRGNETIDASYYAMLDDSRQHAVLVRTHGSAPPGPPSGPATLTGMLLPIESKLQAKLANSTDQLDGVAFDTDYVLELGRRPGNPLVWSVLAAATALLALTMLQTWIGRHVVFRRSDAQPAARPAQAMEPATDQPIPLRASGVFALGSHSQRFTSTPALLIDVEGAPVVCANIDASSSFHGIKVSDRSGIWTIQIGAAGRDLELGHQYYGLTRRPALRIRHGSQAKATTVLAFDDDAQRDAALHRLTGTRRATGV